MGGELPEGRKWIWGDQGGAAAVIQAMGVFGLGVAGSDGVSRTEILRRQNGQTWEGHCCRQGRCMGV